MLGELEMAKKNTSCWDRKTPLRNPVWLCHALHTGFGSTDDSIGAPSNAPI
jgi:hypothetical protein